MSFVREIIDAVLNEIKAALRAYLHESEAAVKKRLQKLLIIGIISSVVFVLITSFIGSASLFLLIGQQEYLRTFLPAWEAWDIMGITSGVIGGLLILALIIIIRNQLRSPKTSATK